MIADMSNSLTALTHNPHPLLTVAEVREVERTAQAGLAAGALMERAAAAAARRALQLSAEHGGPIWLLAGPGNNGGDALVTACLLRAAGANTRVALLADATLYQGDAAQAWQRWGGPATHGLDGTDGLDRASLIIDGLFGIGLNRPLSDKAQSWIERINRCRAQGIPVLALDVPSGLDADSGSIQQHPHSVVRASFTLTFLADKPGLHTRAGVDHAGVIEVDTLGVNLHGSYCGGLNDPEEFMGGAATTPTTRARPRDSHKGSFGSVGIVGGNDGMVGAALLAGRSALMSGAGRVYLRLLSEAAPVYDPLHAELMLRKQFDKLALDVGLIGPGLGLDRKASAALSAVLDSNAEQTPHQLVVDADALTLLGKSAVLRKHLLARNHEEGRVCILTPHPGEAASLLAGTPMAGNHNATVQDARITTALHLAQAYHAIVVLKGAGTVVARPDGLWRINSTGNPGLASGGTGDVLAGLISALLAQHWPAWHTALAAVWLHGAAADQCVAQGQGPIGLTASELLLPIRSLLNQLIQHPPQRRTTRVSSEH